MRGGGGGSGGVCSRGTVSILLCSRGDVRGGRGDVWQGGMHGGGHAW